MPAPIPVLFQDDFLMVFDKPAGMLVVPSPKREKNTLEQVVNREHPAVQQRGPLLPCHRLDRETSGVIVFAIGRSNQQAMMMLFKQQVVRKKYIALVHGKVRHPAGEIKSVIQDVEEERFNRGGAGKLSVTRYKRVLVKHRFSIVEVFPLTGRTHQIRIHMRDLGYPLLGERQYAFGRDFDLKFRRVALHASTIEWKHPITKQLVRVESPLPEDMENFIERN